MTADLANIKNRLIIKSQEPELIRAAFDFATQAYKDRFRLSGENYIVHAARVANYLDKMNLSPAIIAFGILHDILDELPDSAKKIELKEVEKKFGPEMSYLIEKISGLGKIRYSLSTGVKENRRFTKEKIENLRRMFLSLCGDLRVVLIELVSRLDGMNYLHLLQGEKQKIFALETLQIFVPVASRLGLSEIRRNLEDVSFACLLPNKFKWLKDNVSEQYEEREKYLKRFIPHIEKIFKRERINVLDINYRAKSYWSTYQKLLRKEMDINKIHDLLALRIITNDVSDCYKILGIIHKHFRPISEEINDYIAKPKKNGYRSLHTNIALEGNKIIEIQIRTEEMQREAEYGICAHWSYKEKIDLKKEGGNFDWLKNVPDFWKTFKIEFFENKVFCLTPKGDVIVLTKGSTPVDFAYAVHSDIGNHCESAKINGKMVSLSHILENGDVVEVTINKNKLPSKDWLKFVKTSLAKSHIKKLTDSGPSIFRLPLPGFIRKKITEISEAREKKKIEKQKVKSGGIRQIHVAGQKGMLIHIAKCCSPQPGDKVGAYLAQNRATVLHKVSCSNFKKITEKFPEKIVDASWD